MGKLKASKPRTIKLVRFLQILLVLVAFWFIYWAHIYEMEVWNKQFLETLESLTVNILLYSISIISIICLEIYLRHQGSTTEIKKPTETLEDLLRENELLKSELQKSRQTPSSRIGIGFLVFGAIVLSASVAISSSILAFIGLGLTFWGGLFLFTRPFKFVRSTILDSIAVSAYTTIDRITEDLGYRGKPIYIPPYPKEAYLPEYLKGLKEMTVFISSGARTAIPTIEEMAKKQFLLTNPKGICIAPPGYGLVNLLERELKTEFTQIDMDQLCSILPTVIVNNLELAREFEMNLEDDIVHIKVVDSVYAALYLSDQGVRSIHSMGCPLTSAVACALAKTTGKLVVIIKDAISPDSKTIEVWYQTLEA
jgi:hypothetical protein